MQVVPIVPLIFSFQSCDDIMIPGAKRSFTRRNFVQLALTVPVAASGAEKHEPNNAQDQNREPGRHRQQRSYGGARLSLTCFSCGFDDPPISVRCHARPRFSWCLQMPAIFWLSLSGSNA